MSFYDSAHIFSAIIMSFYDSAYIFSAIILSFDDSAYIFSDVILSFYDSLSSENGTQHWTIICQTCFGVSKSQRLVTHLRDPSLNV